MIGTHRLAPEALSVLSAGDGSAGLHELRKARLSKHLLQLRLLTDLVDRLAPDESAAADFGASYAMLTELQRDHPELVADTLSQPQVGAWVAWCLRRLHGRYRGTTPLRFDLAHLGAVVAAVALRAEEPVSVRVAAHDGWLYLPGLGRLRFEGLELRTLATASCRTGYPVGVGSVTLVPVGDAEALLSTAWQPLRHLAASAHGHRIGVALDDVDLYLRQFGTSVGDRLAAGEASDWQEQLDRAWQLLAGRHPHWAEAVAASTVCLVPLPQSGRGTGLSASSADAVGAIALSLPGEGLTFASTLIHESQHSRLNAIHDIVPLHTGSGGATKYSPWRDDPRPIDGVLHGTFAFAGVADFWRREHRLAMGDDRVAELEFAVIVEQVRHGYRTLSEAAQEALTAAGRRVLETIEGALRHWDAEPLSSPVVRLATDLVDEHRITWRLRNLRPVEPFESGLDSSLPESTLVDAGLPRQPLVESRRRRLARRWLNDAASPPDDADGDLNLITGAYATSVERFLDRITEHPTDLNAWSGLAIADTRTAGRPTLLSTRPELVFTLYQATADARNRQFLRQALARIM